MTDDFAHALRIDAIRDGARIELDASDDERSAIAERLGLQRLDRLEAHATLTRNGECVHAEGRLRASLDQACVVTGEPVAAHIDEAFEVRFIPEPNVDSPDAEIELAPEDCDTVFHDGATIDLGNAVADSLALAIDPYPRSAAAEAAGREAGVMSVEQASPFAVLAKLKG
ncbi:MAG: DUF177 domain-containing protein, partial [Sphingomicrobium sp.]